MIKEDNQGLRFNEGKAPMHLVPPDALLELARVFDYGAKKYAPRNWERGMDWSKMTDSLERHLLAFKAGEDIDGESGLHHMAHVTWNALALLTYCIRDIGQDDRYIIGRELSARQNYVAKDSLCPQRSLADYAPGELIPVKTVHEVLKTPSLEEVSYPTKSSYKCMHCERDTAPGCAICEICSAGVTDE